MSLNISPAVNTTIRTVLSLAFLAATAAHLAWFTPANATAVLASLAAIVGAVLALSNLFHIPVGFVNAVQAVLAAIGQVQGDVPSAAIAKLKKAARISTAILIFVLPAGLLASTTTDCGGTFTPPPAPVIAQGEQCAVDIIEDVNVQVTPALVAQTITDCGVAGVDVAAWIQSLLGSASDAGAVTTKKGITVSGARYRTHLEQWRDAVTVYNQTL